MTTRMPPLISRLPQIVRSVPAARLVPAVTVTKAMYANGINAQGTGATRMAVFKGEERTFKYVTGLPDESLISSFPVKNIYCEKGVCYIAVVTADGNQPKVYKIDPATATATQGLSAGVDELGAIGKLIAR